MLVELSGLLHYSPCASTHIKGDWMSPKVPKTVPRFTLGGYVAELDHFQDSVFYETPQWQTLASKLEKGCFIVGRTGSGKSCLLMTLEENERENVIRIDPKNLAMSYITNLDLVKRCHELEIDLSQYWNVLWLHVFIVEIIRHRYNVNSNEVSQSIFNSWFDKFRGDKGKQRALEYLTEYRDSIWEQTHVALRTVTTKINKDFQFNAEISGGVTPLSGKLMSNISNNKGEESVSEEIQRFKNIINQDQLPKLHNMLDIIKSEVLKDSVNFTYIIIDDLDLDWVSDAVSYDLIRVLFQTILELKRIANLKILVALRSNMFQKLDLGSKSGQEEKLRSLVIDMQWSRGDLIGMLNERVSLASSQNNSSINTLAELLPKTNSTRGNPIDFIFERTFLRPRDLIKFLSECLKQTSVNKFKLSWEDIKTAELAYSKDMLMSLRDEWKSNYPGIDLVVEKFKSAPMRMNHSQIVKILDEIALLTSDPTLSLNAWLGSVSEPIYSKPYDGNNFEVYRDLVQILYSIGLIGCTPSDSEKPQYCYENDSCVSSDISFKKIKFFILHPAYQRGLEIRPKEIVI